MFYSDGLVSVLEDTSMLYAVVVTDATDVIYDPVMGVYDNYDEAVMRAVECNYELMFTVSNKEVSE